MIQHATPIPQDHSARRRAGFSFTEILFAVMILGIGFIMVAAVFPVAIKQTQETVEETTAADVAKGAASYLQRIGTAANFPVTMNAAKITGTVVQYTGPLQSATSTGFWQATNGNLILSTDPRFAWIPFYSRNQVVSKDTNGNIISSVPASYAQVTIIAVAARNSSTFSNADLTLQGGIANLEGRPALATFTAAAAPAPDTVTFTADAADGGPASIASEIAEGCYIVIADDSAVPAMATNPSQSTNGFVLRVGNPINIASGQWELLTGSDMKNLRYQPTGGPVKVFVVGRGYSGTSTSPSGPAMDVAAYSTFIQIRGQ